MIPVSSASTTTTTIPSATVTQVGLEKCPATTALDSKAFPASTTAQSAVSTVHTSLTIPSVLEVHAGNISIATNR